MVTYAGQSSGNSGTASVGSIATAFNSSWQPGDFAFLCFRVGNSTGTITTPAGWNLLASGSTGGTYSWAFFYKILAGGDAAPTISWSGSAAGMNWEMALARSQTGAPLILGAASAETDSAAGVNTFSTAAATAASPGELSFAGAVGRATTSVTVTSWTYTPPAGWTAAVSDVSPVSSALNVRFGAIAYQENVPAGSVAPGSSTLTDSAGAAYQFSSLQVLVIELPLAVSRGGVRPSNTWYERFGPSVGQPRQKFVTRLAPPTTFGSSDSGFGADAAGTVSLSDSDSGTGADAGETAGIQLPTVTALVSKTWLNRYRPWRHWVTTPSWTPSAAGTAALSSSDAGSSLDAGEAITAALASQDASGSTDTGTTVGVGAAETGQGADAGEAITAALVSQDAGGSNDQGTTVGVGAADAAAALDGGESIAAALAGSDSGTGADFEAVGIVLPTVIVQPSPVWRQRWHPVRHWLQTPVYQPFCYSDADSGTGTDGGEAVTAILASQDGAGSTDSGTTVGLGAADAGSGSDAAGVIALSGTDAGFSAEAGSAAAFLADADAGSGADGEAVTRQDLLLLVRQPGPAWRARFRRPVLPQWQFGQAAVQVSGADSALGEDAEIDNPFPVAADACAGADGGEAVTAAAAGTDAGQGTDTGLQAGAYDTDAGTGSGSGFLLSAAFTQADGLLAFDQEGHIALSDADAAAGADASASPAVLGSDSGTGTDGGESVSTVSLQFAVLQPARTWLRRFRPRAQVPAAVLFAFADSDACTGTDGGEAAAVTAPASGDDCRGSDGELVSAAVFSQSDSSLAFDGESSVFGPNAFPSSSDACTAADAHIIDVYAYQPPFRWTGGGFELRPGEIPPPG